MGSSHADHRDQMPLCECLSSNDPDVLRAALRREFVERWRAECVANMQADVVKLALDLLVREPDIKSFFGGLTRTMVEESESHVCAVWLIDDSRERCEMWMAYIEDRLFTSESREWTALAFPHDALGEHLMAYKAGWTEAVEYESADPRLPPPVQEFHRRVGVNAMVVAPLIIGNTTLGWLKLSDRSQRESRGNRWWRVMLIEAIARQAALAFHHSRVAERSRLEERRKAILEERNRLARDIHDNLAKGFGAILMQLQAAQRDTFRMPSGVAEKLKTAVDLARTHMIEARRSVGTLRPNVGSGEDLATALKRIASLAQHTTSVPIEVRVGELPHLGDGVEREIVGIAQEALTNAVKHSRAHQITVSAAPVRSIGFRLSVADDGRGTAHERANSGFGLTSMLERAERIGASLTIVTAPRSGTEVILAWAPSVLPTQVHLV